MIRIIFLIMLVSSLLIDAARKFGADCAMVDYDKEMKAQDEWSASLKRDLRRTECTDSAAELSIRQWHWPSDKTELRMTDGLGDRPRLPVLRQSMGRYARALLITCGKWILQQ